MKVLAIGDRFITSEFLQTAMEKQFQDSGMHFEYRSLAFDWPVEPVHENEEIREYVGDDNQVAAKAEDVEVILTHSGPVSKKVIDAAPKLRVVGAARGGPVNINAAACTERGIPVLYAPGRNSGAVAELTVGLMLAETRSIARAHISLMQEHRWRGDLYVQEKVGLEMNSAVIGIIGLGAIGGKVAGIMSGFGARILVHDPHLAASEVEALGYRAVTLDELLKESDIISLHPRLTAARKRV